MTYQELINRAEENYMPFFADNRFQFVSYRSITPWTYADDRVSFDGGIVDIFVSLETIEGDVLEVAWGSLDIQCGINMPPGKYQQLLSSSPSRKEMYLILRAGTIYLNRTWWFETESSTVKWGPWRAVVEGVVTDLP